MLCGEGFEHRKQWIEDRIELLAEYFAISVGGFAVMENHLHLLVRLDPEELKSWSDEEVVRRWITVYTPRNLDLDDEKTTQMWIDHHAKDEKAVARYRERLGELGWFMKALKKPLARMANKEDNMHIMRVLYGQVLTILTPDRFLVTMEDLRLCSGLESAYYKGSAVLQDQHRVAIAEKAVAFVDGCGIGVLHQFTAAKSSYQNQQCTPGQMKVGKQAIDGFKLVRWVDE